MNLDHSIYCKNNSLGQCAQGIIENDLWQRIHCPPCSFWSGCVKQNAQYSKTNGFLNGIGLRNVARSYFILPYTDHTMVFCAKCLVSMATLVATQYSGRIELLSYQRPHGAKILSLKIYDNNAIYHHIPP